MSEDEKAKKPPKKKPPAARDEKTKDPATWGFPAFAKDFPRDPELDDLVAAFARGDYAAVRKRALKLVDSTDDEQVKQAARKLRERIEPDPTSRLVFLLAAGLLAFLTIWWVAHDGPPDGGKQQSGPPTTPSPAKSTAPKPVPTLEHID